MSEKDQDTFIKGPPHDFMPGDEEFDDELESNEEAGGAAPVEPGKPSGRRFGFGFGRPSADKAGEPQGSVRATHERVHIDDRASAIFVLVAAVGLVAILLGSYLGPYVAGMIPAGAVPTLPPLILQTYSAPPATPTSLTSATPVSSASAGASPSASPSASASASPSASASASPSAS